MMDGGDGSSTRSSESVGIPGVPWLTSPDVALYSVIIVNVWVGIPFVMVILYGGLQEIPRELYEAAALDGATGWRAVPLHHLAAAPTRGQRRADARVHLHDPGARHRPRPDRRRSGQRDPDVRDARRISCRSSSSVRRGSRPQQHPHRRVPHRRGFQLARTAERATWPADRNHMHRTLGSLIPHAVRRPPRRGACCSPSTGW